MSMKKLYETLKSARWVEALLLIILLCVMLALFAERDVNRSLSDEERMARMLSSISGAGSVRVMQGKDTGGILVLSEGADDISVMLSLQRAVMAISGLPAEQIEIVKSE